MEQQECSASVEEEEPCPIYNIVPLDPVNLSQGGGALAEVLHPSSGHWGRIDRGCRVALVLVPVACRSS